MDKKLIRKTTEKIAESIEDVLPEMVLEPEKRKKTVSVTSVIF
jgi:hypothetical protein